MYPNSAPGSQLGSKLGLYPIEEGPGEGGSRVRGVYERMRTQEYPSDLCATLPSAYPLIPNGLNGHDDLIGQNKKVPTFKRRRDWPESRVGPGGVEEEGKGVKLIGLPAKVARCEQAVMEVSKVVSKAKEEVKAMTSMGGNQADCTSEHSNGGGEVGMKYGGRTREVEKVTTGRVGMSIREVLAESRTVCNY